MADIARKRTKLEKHYYKMRLITVGVNYCFLTSLVCLILSFSFLLIPIFAMLYVIYALFASVIMIACTLFFILVSVGEPDNPLHILWDRLNHIEEVMEPIINFSRIGVPIIGGITIALSIFLIVLVSKNLGRSNKIKDKVLLILSIIFLVIAIIISQAVKSSN